MTAPDLARLRARLQSELASCLAFETRPQVRAHISGEYQELFALLAEVDAGRALRERFTTDPDCGCADCCGDRLATLAYDAARAGGS